MKGVVLDTPATAGSVMIRSFWFLTMETLAELDMDIRNDQSPGKALESLRGLSFPANRLMPGKKLAHPMYGMV
jgi:hypothetical protein